MSGLDAFLESYLDLARQIDPLRYPEPGSGEAAHRLGLFGPAAARAQLAALRSVANAVEELPVEALDDEIDRTMLLNTIRADVAGLDAAIGCETSNPARVIAHLNAALTRLMGEDFDAHAEAALRARVAAIPGFLEAARSDSRPAPELLVQRARADADFLESSTLDEASERLDDAAVQPALVALVEHRRWLDEDDRVGGSFGWAAKPFESLLAAITTEPLGVKGTFRVLELRRAGVERSLAGAAGELGGGDPFDLVQRLVAEAAVPGDLAPEYWDEEWTRTAAAMTALGLAPGDEAPDPVPDPLDGWSMAARAVRGHAVRMLATARTTARRPVRRWLVAPGLDPGWGRSVAALLRNTDVFGLPERRLMVSYLALREAAAAEADLALHARLSSVDDVTARLGRAVGATGADLQGMMSEIAAEPLTALAAALSHEAWQSWYADTGGEPADFIRSALAGGGLAVPLARWAAGEGGKGS